MTTFVDDLMILVGIIVVCVTVVVLACLVAGTLVSRWEAQKEPELIEERTVEITFSPDSSPVEQLRVMRTVMRAIDEPMPQTRTNSRSTDVTIWNGIEGL